MTEFTITFSRRRWESTDIQIRAADASEAERAAKEMLKNGLHEDRDWDSGDVCDGVEVEIRVSSDGGAPVLTFTDQDET